MRSAKPSGPPASNGTFCTSNAVALVQDQVVDDLDPTPARTRRHAPLQATRRTSRAARTDPCLHGGAPQEPKPSADASNGLPTRCRPHGRRSQSPDRAGRCADRIAESETRSAVTRCSLSLAMPPSDDSACMSGRRRARILRGLRACSGTGKSDSLLTRSLRQTRGFATPSRSSTPSRHSRASNEFAY